MNLLSSPSARALARRALSFINSSSASTTSARPFRFSQSLLERENNHHVAYCAIIIYEAKFARVEG